MIDNISEDTWTLLEEEARRINSPAFIADDPVQFPRRFTSQPDAEIASLLSATIAWGNRRMICRDCDRMLALMGHDPHAYVMEQAYEDLPDGNIHRTFFNRNLRHFLRGLHRVYSRHATLEDFARACGATAAEAPSWHLVEALNNELREANGGCDDSRCLPLINMALRWLVRDDGIVDLGMWKALRPSQLFIPLDVHVGNTARQLGLIDRRANDRRTVIELTSLLRRRRPDYPLWFDFALFGIGIGAVPRDDDE